MRRGPLIVISGPSGSGKSTLIRALLNRFPKALRLSVSATTRTPRRGEREGRDYYFWSPEQFEHGIRQGEFLEYAQVHGSDYYGTLIREVEPYRDAGMGVILEVDVAGANQIRSRCLDPVTVFLKTEDFEEYEQRLRKRGTESEEKIRRRIETARRELVQAQDYQYQIINDDLARATEELSRIVAAAIEGKPDA